MKWFERTRVIVPAGIALGFSLAVMSYVEGCREEEHEDILDAVRFQPSGTWVELEDGTARAEWLRYESLSEWASRARFAADLAKSMNERGGPR